MPPEPTVLSRIVTWADARPDIVALVQIGSRVQSSGVADTWSDYDFQLLTRSPAAYRDPAVLRDIGPSWLASAQPAFGNATKLTVILDDAAEADFIVLPAWQLRIVFALLRFPRFARFWPPPLRHGVRDLRIVACPGWQVLKGGATWEARYARLGRDVPWPRLTERELRAHASAFWAASVWVAKKLGRGEVRAAQREFHRVLTEKLWLVLEDETRDRTPGVRPEARHAERWLPAERLAETAFTTAPESAAMWRALSAIAENFAAASHRLAAARGWKLDDHTALHKWLAAQRPASVPR